MGIKLYFPSGPTKAQRAADDAEEIANTLAEVKAGLKRKHVTDPKVWSGHPDGWSPGDEDDENDHVEVGLFQNLERCTRSNSTWQMAMAIRIAFELGKAAIVGEADPVAADRVVAGMEARRLASVNANEESSKRRRTKADKRDRAAFYDRWWKKRGRHLAAGCVPKTSKDQLLDEIMPTLTKGEPGSSESTVLRAFRRWERGLKSRAQDGLDGSGLVR